MILEDRGEGEEEEMGTIRQQEKNSATDYQAEKETWKEFSLTNHVVKRDSGRFVLPDLEYSVNVAQH